jgi:hypothetical protein
MATAADPPALLSVPRITTLLSSLLVALGSGTNYVRTFMQKIGCWSA